MEQGLKQVLTYPVSALHYIVGFPKQGVSQTLQIQLPCFV